jgi:tetratricopeptide (TPR) repeat protein
MKLIKTALNVVLAVSMVAGQQPAANSTATNAATPTVNTPATLTETAKYAPTAKEMASRFDHYVRGDFFLGFSGNLEALDSGIQKCETILQEQPNHPEAMVWLGSGLYFKTGQAFMKGDQKLGMQLYMKSQRLMAKAVELAPNDISVRIPRGATLLTATQGQELDDRVRGEVETARDDYEKVLELQSSYLDKLSTHAKGELFIGIASSNARLGQNDRAKEFYSRIVKEMPGTVYAKKADKWLTTGELAPRERQCLGCHTGK